MLSGRKVTGKKQHNCLESRQYQTVKKSKKELLLFVTFRADVYLTEVRNCKSFSKQSLYYTARAHAHHRNCVCCDDLKTNKQLGLVYPFNPFVLSRMWAIEEEKKTGDDDDDDSNNNNNNHHMTLARFMFKNCLTTVLNTFSTVTETRNVLTFTE